jgi:hypothetical protein
MLDKDAVLSSRVPSRKKENPYSLRDNPEKYQKWQKKQGRKAFKKMMKHGKIAREEIDPIIRSWYIQLKNVLDKKPLGASVMLYGKKCFVIRTPKGEQFLDPSELVMDLGQVVDYTVQEAKIDNSPEKKEE